MAKRIRIIPWLDRDEFDKQLNKLGKEKHKINVDVNGDGADDMVHKLHTMNSAGTKSTSIFGKMINVISDTFSSGKLAMTGYLAVLRGIDTAADKAKDSIEALNKAETDLMIATDMSRESVRGLMKDYNSYAKELSSTTGNISDAANDYLRAGKTLEESQALIKDSIMLSKLGDVESATATEDLLATMNGYEMSIEGVDRALDAMVAIDMKAATSAGDLATGLKYSASSANSAGLSFNKLIAILGTVQDKTMMGAEVVGTFANTMLARYRDITIGKYLSDDGEDISNYESVLKSCGLELRDSKGEFRAFEDVLEEMASKWDSLTSAQQNALIKVAAGTRQQNRFIALMEGYNKVLELTEVAANSAGTAVDKFNSSYMTSLEAKENTLQASFESMIYNSDLEEVYGDILDATTALVDFINQTNTLKGVMTSLAVTGGIKGFLTIKTGIHDAYINLNQFQNALNMVKQINISSADFDRLLLLTNNLSESQMRLILSTDALSISQKEDLLVARGLSREEAKLKLQTYGVTQAQTGLTASTTSAKTAMQGFISVLKANPLLVIATAISTVSMVVSTYKNHLEEVRKATEQSATAYKDSTSSISDYVSRYQDLQKALKDAIDSGRIQKGTDEWLEMQSALTSVESEILDCKTSIEEFNNELLELNWQIFERVQTEIGNVNDELGNLAGLFDDFNDINVSDGKGNWTSEAIATLGLYAQQMEASKYQVQQYSDAIAQLEADYQSGKYSATEYMDKLAELKQEQWNAVESVEAMEDAIVSLNETRINESIETIEEEISAFRELTASQIESIEATEELRQKQEELSEKSKTVADIEKQLAAMQNDTTASTVAKRKLLEEELAEAKKDLADTEHDYSIEAQKDALNKQADDFEESRNAEIEALEESLNDRETLISQSFETVKQNADVVGQEIAMIAQEHGVTISDAIITSWSNGETAIASYGETLSAQSSAFIGNIMDVENEVYALQTKADTASIAISNMFGNRADTLVSELLSSYTSEENLNNMTNTLQESLVNTLERGYEISEITDGLNSIAKSATDAANALRDMYTAMNDGGTYTPSPYSAGNPYQNVVDHAQKTDKASQTLHGYSVVDKTGSAVQTGFKTKDEAEKYLNEKMVNTGGRYKIQAYAKGGLVKKDDNNILNPIAEALREDTVIVASEGESILTQKQTNMLQNLANVAPDINQLWNVPDYTIQTPVMQRNNAPNVTINYDSMLHVDNFTDAPHLIGAIEKSATKVTTKILNDINRDFRIHSR